GEPARSRPLDRWRRGSISESAAACSLACRAGIGRRRQIRAVNDAAKIGRGRRRLREHTRGQLHPNPPLSIREETVADFAGKVAIVTGAASGIGGAVALLYARGGARVVVSDVSEEGGSETVRLIREAGGEARFVRTDVSRPEECDALIRETVEAFGRLDIACNNAGIGGEASHTADYTIEGWRQVLDINLSGAMYCMKYENAA